MAIGSEGGVEQPFDRLGRLTVQGKNVRHVLPFRHQWRMGRRKRGL